MKMYSPSSPTLSHSLEHPSVGLSGSSNGSSANHPSSHHSHYAHHLQEPQNSHCLRFKYFTTFIICTTCLALLSASLATHKWIVSKPIRILKLNGGQTNLTSLMLTAHSDTFNDQRNSYHHHLQPAHLLSPPLNSVGVLNPETVNVNQLYSSHNNKFQGEIYFGLFKGVKVLNYGFGDRLSPISGKFIPFFSDFRRLFFARLRYLRSSVVALNARQPVDDQHEQAVPLADEPVELHKRLF